MLQITLVGKIISALEAPTHLSFTIDDGTGKIDLSYWTSGDDEQEQVSKSLSLWPAQCICSLAVKMLHKVYSGQMNWVLQAGYTFPPPNPASTPVLYGHAGLQHAYLLQHTE